MSISSEYLLYIFIFIYIIHEHVACYGRFSSFFNEIQSWQRGNVKEFVLAGMAKSWHRFQAPPPVVKKQIRLCALTTVLKKSKTEKQAMEQSPQKLCDVWTCASQTFIPENRCAHQNEKEQHWATPNQKPDKKAACP